jgi:replicative DNA helicase
MLVLHRDTGGAAKVAERSSIMAGDVTLEKTLPQSIESEKAVLGAILLDEKAIFAASETLMAEDFYLESHREIFKAMLALVEKESSIDFFTLREELRRRSKEEIAGGAAYLTSLTDGLPRALNVGHYAKTIREKSMARQLIRLSNETTTRCYQGDERAGEILEHVESQIFRIAARDLKGGFQPVLELAGSAYKEIEEASRHKGIVSGLDTGFADLNRMTGGLHKQNLVVVAARPGLGKTSLCLNIACHAAINGGKSTGIFSLEMSKPEIMKRMISSLAEMDANRIQSGYLTRDDWAKINRATSTLSAAPIYIDDSANLTMLQVRAKAQRLAMEHGIDLLVVDYLQLISGSRRFENRTQEVTEISRGLKNLAKELDVPVIAVSQLNREVEKRSGNRRPQLSDLRESGCLAGDTLVTLASGRRIPIRDLVGMRDFEVWSLNERTLKLETSTVFDAFCTGSKPVLKLTTALGRSIRATANHQFLTTDAWKRLDELGPDDRIALPRKLDQASVPATMSDAELGLLGQMIGNGCFLPGHAIQYTTRHIDLAALVARYALELFGGEIKATINPERTWIQVYLSSKRRHTHGVHSVVREWFERYGLFGKRSHEKFVPTPGFVQPEAAIRLFLRNLWPTDGHIGLRAKPKTYPSVHYASASERLARDVQSLLLRVGINATLRSTAQMLGRDLWTVHVSGKSDLEGFITKIGSAGLHQARVMRSLQDHLLGILGNTNRDVIPLEVVSRLVGTAAKGHNNYSRERAGLLAVIQGQPELQMFSESDVYWDRIASISEDGTSDVYDLTVPRNECFVAGDIIVHNSIEQDSDLVLFISREGTDDDVGAGDCTAGISIAKQRNGMTGTFNLTFRKRITKFENYYKESDAII